MRGCWRPNRTATYWPPILLAITAFLSPSPGLLNRGPGGPASLRHVPQFSIFSPTGLIPNCSIGAWGLPLLVLAFSTASCLWLVWSPNWLNLLCTELYNSSTSTFFLWTSQSHSFNPSTVKVTILIFLERMHLLFTLEHFLSWQTGGS